MPQVDVDQTCTCPCGGSACRVGGRPLVRFICHCTICQSVYRKPHADVTAFWSSAITLDPGRPAQFRRYRAPPALRRGTCAHCGAPVVGFLGLAPFLALAFVPSARFPDPAVLPLPRMHIFYDRRIEEADDALPRFSGYWPSQFAVARVILGRVAGRR